MISEACPAFYFLRKSRRKQSAGHASGVLNINWRRLDLSPRFNQNVSNARNTSLMTSSIASQKHGNKIINDRQRFLASMLKLFGIDSDRLNDRLNEKLKRNASWLRRRLPWPFSKKKPVPLVFIVHVNRDSPHELTRHYFRRMVTDKQRSFLAFLSFCLSVASLGLASHLLALGAKAIEFSRFVNLINSVGVLPLASLDVFVSGIEVAAYAVGSIQCCRAMASSYRSARTKKHKWITVYSFVLLGGLIGLAIIIVLTIIYGFLADTIFRVTLSFSAHVVHPWENV